LLAEFPKLGYNKPYCALFAANTQLFERMDAMRVYHPLGAYQGLPSENVFFVMDDMDIQQGTGYVMPFLQPDLFPQRPMHLYMQLEAPPSCQYMLFGALLARVSQLREQNPHMPTRLYTQLAVDDARNMEFFMGNGFSLDDAEDLVRFPVPEVGDKIPMGVTFANVPLRNEFEQQAMLGRMNLSRIAPLDLNSLGQCMQRPHFLALGIYRNEEPVGEVMLSGSGDRAVLAALYIRSTARRLGLGKALLTRALSMLREEGVTQVEALVLRRSAAQCAIAKSFGARFIRTTCFYPGIDIG
jgi:GNAT superfamily N-acetyltransferase